MSSKENAFVSGGKTMRDEANIEITPSAELEFIAPQGTKYSRADLTVKNNGDTSAAFKVKTTTPKRYCVRPSSGVIQPGETKKIEMSLLAKEMEGMASGLTSDKFLIQTMECDPNFQPKEKKEEFKNPDNNVRDTKLRVRLTYPRGVKPKTKGGSGSEGSLLRILVALIVLGILFAVVHKFKPAWTAPVIAKAGALYGGTKSVLGRLTRYIPFIGKKAADAGADAAAEAVASGAAESVGNAAADTAADAVADGAAAAAGDAAAAAATGAADAATAGAEGAASTAA